MTVSNFVLDIPTTSGFLSSNSFCTWALNMVLKSRYFILSYDEGRGFYLCMPLSKLVCVTSFLPLFSLSFCVIWSLMYYFTDITFTHCKVWNYLPSLSAAIGNHMTQYVISCLCITLHSPGRFLFASIYYRFYSRTLKGDGRYIAKVACSLNVVECTALIGLSYWTSSGAYEYHKKFFLTFVACSELYMLLVCLLMNHIRKNINSSLVDEYSLRMKIRLLVINAISFAAAGYFFVRHNNYCEPGIYSLFAFFEYIVALSNIGFHLTASIDFKGEFITISKGGIDVR